MPTSSSNTLPVGCWIWHKAIGGNGYGYGWCKQQKKVVPAHRLVYQLLVGAIPPGKELDHKCRTVACVNPAHLEIVSHRENMLRGVSPIAINAKKKLCKKGHTLNGKNLITDNRNQRRCRICSNEYDRKRYHEHKHCNHISCSQ